MIELELCPYCKSAEVFYSDYDTFSDSRLNGRCLEPHKLAERIQSFANWTNYMAPAASRGG